MTSSYHLEDKKKSVPKLRFKGYNDEWKEIRLGKHLNICRGASPRPIEKYITMQNDGVNWIKIGDISPKENVIKCTKEKITKEGAKYSRYVKKGDLILSNSMSFGRPYILEIDGCIHDGWLLIQDLEKLFDKKYLCYLLDSDAVKQQYRKYAAGGVVINLNSELVKSVSVFIPTIQEQEKIASFLTLIDKKIEKQKEFVELLKKYKRGLLSQIFSQKLRFKDDKGNDYPDWKEKRLGDICKIVGGGTPDTNNIEYWGDDINWFTPTEIIKKYVDSSNRKISKLGLLKSSAKILPMGTVLLTTRATLGEMSILQVEATTNQGFQSLIPDKNALINEFIYYCQPIIKYYCYKYANGSTFLEISKQSLSKLKLLIPEINEQIKITKYLSEYDYKIQQEEYVLNNIIKYKNGLLQQLFI